MNFSAFGGPFSGIHFAAKFQNDTNFSNSQHQVQDIHQNHRYNNHFNQSHISGNAIQYGQNIAIPYATQQQNDHHNNIFNAQTPDHKNHIIKTKIERDRDEVINQQILQNVNQSWQTLANPASSVDYSSHLLSATLPISIQHFLKYSETMKKETSMNGGNGVVGGVISGGGGNIGIGTVGGSINTLNSGNLNLNGVMDNSISGFNIKNELLCIKNGNGHIGTNLNLTLGGGGGGVGMSPTMVNNNVMNGIIGNGIVSGNLNHILDGTNLTTSQNTVIATNTGTGNPTTSTTSGKKKKKKPPKEKKPRPKPGEIRETRALDGSVLYCCPECQMAYPDRSLIEQHVISHAVERRFVCDICNAALKRKDHLTRHKLSHIPDRPHVCNICLKSFKRKEQLTLHIVIHSGEKKHTCLECGKGFYRKDHLRKHTRSHIARRVKSEVTSQTINNSQGMPVHGS